ncbi:MAG: gliding motility-associated C-terminal domain-containing protein, partial [Flavobacteriales bacterium]|nr:gliding motility-associated C-terminal domain-containing protein [Flavobacteriales bacterium]
SHSDANCGQPDGIATVTVTGGTFPYTYLWSNGANTAFITNVFAGTYIITVTDANGCLQVLPVTIADLAGPVATISGFGNVGCYGGSDGFATVFVTGGIAPYAYQWDDPFNQTVPTAASLPAGIYTVSATDTNGCVASTSVTISQPDSLTFNPSLTDPTCFGDCDGSAGVSVIGGTTPYTYLWNDPGTQTTATATGLCSGIYSVNITDSNNCGTIGAFGLVDPLPMTASSISADESCLGSCDGSATVSVTNGTFPFTYLWDDPGAQGTPTAGSLCAGNYNVTITDANGCFTTSSATIGSPPLLVTAIASSGNVSCFGFCDGFAQSTTNGGTPPYTYLWDDGQSAGQAIGLCAGVYNLLVTDANGCTATTNVTITEPQGMVVTTSTNDVTCFGACNGNATASLSGGTPPFTYLWDDISFQTTTIATNLCNGFYSVTVTDNNGCIQTASVVITQPQQLGLASTINASTCGFNNGSACVNEIGGVAPFVIQWDDPATTIGACAMNLFAGVYNPIVSDANGCFFTMPVIVNDLTGPVVDTVTWTNVTCGGDSNGTATVVASGVSPPFTYVWRSGSDTIGLNITTVFGLWGGTFTITVIDANGCISGAAVTINEPTAVASAIISTNDASCFGICNGSAAVMAGGGTAPYTYSWTNGQTTTSASGLCAGPSNVNITDGNGCGTSSPVNINEPPPLVVNDSIINVTCSGDADGAIYLNVTGGSPFYSYGWFPNIGNGPIVTNLLAQPYNVTIQDINGCVLNEIYNVVEPLPLGFAYATAPSFCGGANGQATVTATGGTTPYTYLWPDGQTTPTATNLIAGVIYIFELSDANGCTVNIPITVNNNAAPVISVSAQPVLCFGDDNGQATVVVDMLGTPPFTYQWDDPLNQNTATAGLLVGNATYNVVVTDVLGCTASSLVYVPENPELVLITVGDTTICYGDAVEISVTGSGGFISNDYSYTWSNGVITQNQWVTPLVTTTYTVWIEDDAGCRSVDTGYVTVTVLPQISLTVTDPVRICYGDDAYLSAVAAGGAGQPYAYTWSNFATGPDQTISGLTSATSYSVTVTDACPQDAVATINVIVNPVPDVAFTVTGSGCAPYVFTADTASQGGVPPVPIDTWMWYFGDGSVSTEAFNTTHIYTSADTFDVSLVVVSFDGCKDSTSMPGAAIAFEVPVAGFDIMQNGQVLDPAETTILTPTIDFVTTTSDSVPIATWYWDFGDNPNDSNNYSTLENPSHMYTDTGTYTVMQVVTTVNLCPDTIYHDVTITGDYIIFAPNAFTPNGDEDNDFFFPKGIGVDGSSFELYIFDRWGDLIATVKGIWSDDIMIGWDGRANNGTELAQIDVYVWLIRTEDFNGDG